MAELDLGTGKSIEKDVDLGGGKKVVDIDLGEGTSLGGESKPSGLGPAFKEGSWEAKNLQQLSDAFGKSKFGQAVGAYSYATYESIIDMSPITFAKYTRTEERDKFMKMSKTDQHKELLWETVMTELFTAGGMAIGKVLPKAIAAEKQYLHPLIGKGVKKVGGKIKGVKPKPKPGNYPEYKSYRQEAKELIMKQEKVSEKEAMAIVEHIQGNPNAVNLLDKETSPVFDTIAKRTKDGLLVKPSKLKQYSPKRVQIEASRQRFVDSVQNKLGVQDKGVILEDIEAVYKGGLRKIYGEPKYDVSYKQNFKDAAPELLDDMTRHVMDTPNLAYRSHRLYTKPSPIVNITQPARFVFEKLEPVLKAHSKIYKPIKTGGEWVTDKHLGNIQSLMRIFAEKGLTKISKLRGGKVGFLRKRAFTKQRLDTAYEIMREMDSPHQADPNLIKRLIKQKASNPEDAKVIAHIIDGTRDWFDERYVEQVLVEIPRAFEKLGMSSNDRAGLSVLLKDRKIGNETFKGIETRLQELFDPKNAKKFADKSTGLKQILLELQGYAESFGADADAITKNLSMDNGKFTKYLENYFTRVAKKEVAMANRVVGKLPKDQEAYYAQQRTKHIMDDPVVDYEDAITRYSRTHARETTGYYEVYDDAITHINEMPSQQAQAYASHWLGKKLGLPTNADVALADLLDNIPGLTMTPKRLMNAGQIIQNAAMSGFLGFKPFSAARNMFQPLFMTPAELGNNGFRHLVKGFRYIFSKAHRDEMRQLKVFTDPLPDYERQLKFMRFGKGRQKLGFELPTYQGVVDATLTAYKASDSLWNRMWSSGAAKDQWLKGLKSIGIKTAHLGMVNDAGGRASSYGTPHGKLGVPDASQARKFLHNVQVQNRSDTARYNIENLVGKGKWYEAWTEHVRDVVANTQFLYGPDDAPLALQRLGAAGRAATTFQSWWMNYGQAMTRWMAMGEKPSDNMLRSFNWALSGTVAAGIMSKMWGKETALRSVLVGPFPSGFDFFSNPVAMQIQKGMETVWNAGALGMDFAVGASQEEIDKSEKALERSAKSFLRSSVNLWMPMGLISRQVGEAAYDAPSGQKGKAAARAFLGLKKAKKIPLAR